MRKSSTSERDLQAKSAETVRRGGMVILAGGPWDGHWYFQDAYDQEPLSSSRKVGYLEAREQRENPGGCGLGTVWRYNPAAVPAVVVPIERSRPSGEAPRCEGCGQKLLLIRPGRVRCEACRVAAVRAGEPDAA